MKPLTPISRTPISRIRIRLLGTAIIIGAASFALPAVAQSGPQAWPAKPIKIVVPFPPGGGTDLVARALGQKLAERLKQPVLIENRPGASTVIGTDAVVKAAPDGYTLLLSGSTSYSVNPALRKLPYDPLRDLAPVAIVAQAPLVLVVNAGSPWQNVADLLAAARAKPLGVRYATFGSGSAPHLTGELLALAGGVQLQDVPYKGGSQSTVALIGGEIEMSIDTAASVAPHVRSGKLRALGIVGPSRSSLLPGVPTLAEQKLPEATFDAWYGLSAPAGTPASVIESLMREVRATMADPALQEQLRAQGMEPVLIGAADFRSQMSAEIQRYRALAERASISAE